MITVNCGPQYRHYWEGFEDAVPMGLIGWPYIMDSISKLEDADS